MGSSSPTRGAHKKYLSCHHLVVFSLSLSLSLHLVRSLSIASGTKIQPDGCSESTDSARPFLILKRGLKYLLFFELWETDSSSFVEKWRQMLCQLRFFFYTCSHSCKTLGMKTSLATLKLIQSEKHGPDVLYFCPLFYISQFLDLEYTHMSCSRW